MLLFSEQLTIKERLHDVMTLKAKSWTRIHSAIHEVRGGF